MAIYNTSSDSSNTAVRAFLTKVGEYYWEKSFNTGSGASKKVWEDIRDIIFNGSCAYCGDSDSKLQIEHLIMFNRKQFGLHHPGNVVPVCNSCNKRKKDINKNYLKWEDQLEEICKENNDLDAYFERKKRINNHINSEKYAYPKLKEAETQAIRVIANMLYENIKIENEKALELYKELDKVFVKKE